MKGLDIARRRLRNTRLTGTSFDAPEEAVRWHGAMQAQDYGPAKWSIGQRTMGVVDEDLDAALSAGAILRTHVLRPTWHFVARDDIRWLLALTGPRVHKHNGPRYRELGLDVPTLARCEALIAAALEGGNQLTRDTIAGLLDSAGIDRSGQRLPHILMHCELHAAICSGGLSGKQHTYALLDERAPRGGGFDRDEALVELARRYLASHGPATVQDLRWWSSLTAADTRKALGELGAEVQSETIDGITFWSIASDVTPGPNKRAGHLLHAYDELIVGYTQSRYFGDPRGAAARAVWRDRSLPNGVLLVNGGVYGHWRRTMEEGRIRLEVLVYQDLKRDEARALQAAAGDLGRFLAREVTLQTTRLQ